MNYDYAGVVALADPTRRQIFDLVRVAPRSVAELTRQVRISQPAVSQHLKVLRHARLVTSQPRGASNMYFVDQEGLLMMRDWLDSLWDEALQAFAAKINEGNER